MFYQKLHQLGILEAQAPATLRELRVRGQRGVGEIVDRYQITCRPVRGLLVDYLRERQPALDYTSLKSLAYHLAGVFWADIEHHHPGIDSLHLPADVARAWKQRLQTKTATVTTATGEKTTTTAERLSYRECLTPVRAVYLDLAHWAIEDPARWAQWVAPCPVGDEEVSRRKSQRRRKARMDARTRERLPVLPALVRTAGQRRDGAAALLAAARGTLAGRSAAVRPAGPAQAGNHQPAQLRQGIEDNLRSLAVGHLAAVNLRLMDDAEPDQRFDDQLAAMVKARDEPRAWRSEITGRRITLVNCCRKGVMSMTSRSTPRYVLGTATVSRVGFGAMQLPGPGVFGPPRDRDEAIGVLRRAVELGVDHIDTAQYYGPDVANELIRSALYPYPEGLALVSKVGARRDKSGGVLRYDQPAQLRQGIEDNLRSLAVGHLAAVNLRLMDDAEPDQRFDDQLAAMVKARDNGLIGGVGLSNVTRDHLLHALSVTDIACVQNPMNLADRASMPVLEECYARGIAFVPFFPLGSAFTQGNPVLGSPQVIRTAARLGHTPAQVALAWLLSLRPNVLLIPGTSSIRHLQENMAVANIELDAEARELLAPMA